jgi:hypothetical protein
MIIIFTGCSNSLKSENDALKKELTEVKNKVSNLESANKDLTNQLEEEKEKNSTIKLSVINNKDNIYTIYTANPDTYKKEADAYVYIPNSIDLKQKLTSIANALSEGYFSNLPIQVLKIEEANNKKIAVINLKESNENQGVKDYGKFKGESWALNYIQGSAGGSMTSVALIETLLQRDHTGEWIDGVRFLYNGGACDVNLFQNAPDLTKINYRK